MCAITDADSWGRAAKARYAGTAMAAGQLCPHPPLSSRARQRKLPDDQLRWRDVHPPAQCLEGFRAHVLANAWRRPSSLLGVYRCAVWGRCRSCGLSGQVPGPKQALALSCSDLWQSRPWTCRQQLQGGCGAGLIARAPSCADGRHALQACNGASGHPRLGKRAHAKPVGGAPAGAGPRGQRPLSFDPHSSILRDRSGTQKHHGRSDTSGRFLAPTLCLQTRMGHPLRAPQL